VNRLRLGQSIVKAIERCETVCNPALINKQKYTIYVRKMSDKVQQSWLVILLPEKATKAARCIKAVSTASPTATRNTSTN